MTWLSDLEAEDPVGYLHSVRFRRVANGYPRTVALAYHHDLTAAALATDQEVAGVVAAWEAANGIAVRDWQAIGERERADDDDQ